MGYIYSTGKSGETTHAAINLKVRVEEHSALAHCATLALWPGDAAAQQVPCLTCHMVHPDECFYASQIGRDMSGLKTLPWY